MTFDIHAVEPGDEGEMLSHPGDSTPMQVQQNEDERFLIPEGTAITLPAFAVAGLFSDICRRERTTGKSSDCSRRGASAAEGHFETGDHLQPGIAARPVGLPIAGSSLVRRLVLAKHDPAKHRIRAWLSDIDDERLFRLGLASEDIAALRGTASPEVSKE